MVCRCMTADGPPTRVVNYSDLDLTPPAGAAHLYVRIRAAARAVCEPQYEPLVMAALARGRARDLRDHQEAG